MLQTDLTRSLHKIVIIQRKILKHSFHNLLIVSRQMYVFPSQSSVFTNLLTKFHTRTYKIHINQNHSIFLKQAYKPIVFLPQRQITEWSPNQMENFLIIVKCSKSKKSWRGFFNILFLTFSFTYLLQTDMPLYRKSTINYENHYL